MRHNRFEILSPSVLQLVKTVQSIKSRKMAEYDLKGTNALCLCEILNSGEEGLSATELARCCEIDKAQVSRCMKEMVDKGLIYRDDQDGRRYKQKYRLTEAGVAAARDIEDTSRSVQKTVHKGLSAEDMEAFYRITTIMCRNFAELYEENN